MKKQITGFLIVLMVIGVSITVFISIQYANSFQNIDDPKMEKKADIVMPTKVSRPGCEKDNSCYSPSTFIIIPETLVTWVNEDSAFHSVTSGFYGEPTGLFDSGYLDPEESFTFYFDSVGTFDYFCTLHPWMKGQIIVKLE